MRTDESDFIWSCGRKRKFKTSGRAAKVLEQGKKSGHYSSDYHIYRCKYCMWVHIGGRKNGSQGMEKGKNSA